MVTELPAPAGASEVGMDATVDTTVQSAPPPLPAAAAPASTPPPALHAAAAADDDDDAELARAIAASLGQPLPPPASVAVVNSGSRGAAAFAPSSVHAASMEDEDEALARAIAASLADAPDGGGGGGGTSRLGNVVRRVIDADNSCLFNAVRPREKTLSLVFHPPWGLRGSLRRTLPSLRVRRSYPLGARRAYV